MEQLCRRLKETGGVLVAFSGGVDSTFLLKTAREVLGERVLAVTAVSATYPDEERRAARRLARSFGVEQLEVETDEWNDPRFRANSPSRCYHCKKHLFRRLSGLAAERNLVLVDATNYSDRLDYRPGDRAARLYRVRRPLLEAGLTKADIRLFSRRLKLATADKPAAACLASRIPYGIGLTRSRLRAVAEGEACLRRLGFKGNLRLRHHGSVARLEIDPEFFQRALRFRRAICRSLGRLGFPHVTLDLEGYRTGSLNRGLERAKK
ncbi:MAG TPA: ATP-dependent sacrificial sulfur transferase LarE [bacterium]|nr:ATP-dependent sacrificial sulfur transferase LarE [bacterium]